MKRFFFFIILFSCFFLNSMAQKSDMKPKAPKEDIKVNREYDEKGNLIKFDSIYSYSWSGDSTLMNSFSPEDFQKSFGGHFGFFSDSTFFNHSFFKDFEQMFAQPFGGRPDSLQMKKFGQNHFFQEFGLKSDTLRMEGLEDFFNNFNRSESDSTSADSLRSMQPKTMDELMKILQQQMQQMQEQHRKFLQEHP